jgi:imidazoleglycerol phosphate dehydratase HisB
MSGENRDMARTAQISRSTKETSIEVSINLDGSGIAEISTGIPFYDHMLEQLARHGGFDLSIQAKGDLHIDTHHTVEDVAICVGVRRCTKLSVTKPVCVALQVARIRLMRPW